MIVLGRCECGTPTARLVTTSVLRLARLSALTTFSFGSQHKMLDTTRMITATATVQPYSTCPGPAGAGGGGGAIP